MYSFVKHSKYMNIFLIRFNGREIQVAYLIFAFFNTNILHGREFRVSAVNNILW